MPELIHELRDGLISRQAWLTPNHLAGEKEQIWLQARSDLRFLEPSLD